MEITQQLHDSKGRKMNIYSCGDENGEFLFKEIMNDQEFYLMVDTLQLDENKKSVIVDFLKYRRDNFNSLPYA